MRDELGRMWREFLCWARIATTCHHSRDAEIEQLAQRYNHLEQQVAIERRQWMPRDIWRIER